MEQEQDIQEAQYSYPYHYIPDWRDGKFSQTQHWSWGFRYLGGMKVVFDELSDLSFRSLVDIGCGDGRFVREMNRRYPEKEVLGVDYSERAITLARAMNPSLEFETRNILEDPIERTFDVATLIEVLEHIPPDQVEQFIERVRGVLEPEGCLLITVPHVNKSVSDKHYQHFDTELLNRILDPHFQNVSITPFDAQSKVLSFIQILLGGNGRNFIITNSVINSLFMKYYLKRFLYGVTENNCGRIAAFCRI